MHSELADPPASATPACDDTVAREAVALAEALLRNSLEITTSAETAQMARVGQLVESPQAKSLSMLMTDRLFAFCFSQLIWSQLIWSQLI